MDTENIGAVASQVSDNYILTGIAVTVWTPCNVGDVNSSIS